MPRIKVSELSGAALDWAVAKCENKETWLVPEDYFQGGTLVFHNEYDWVADANIVCSYSTNWAQGGPIIEREKIDIGVDWATELFWLAGYEVFRECMKHEQVGPTPLIAAMRCYVTSKLGGEIDVPEELL